jgi:hypothetical protein
MRKIIIIAALILAVLQGQAQFDLGLKVGYSTSKLSTDFDDIKEDVKHNFQFGAFARIGKRFYLQPELYYATSGGTLNVTGSDDKVEIKLNTLVVPALLGFKIINGEKINLRIMAGPTANFIVNEKISGDELLDPITDSDLKNIAWGLDAGAGIDFLFLALDIRYEWGLNDLYKPEGDNQSMKSNIFIISLGFKLL